MNDIIAIIITYNAGVRIKKSIEALNGSVGEVVVVDNGSCSETINILDELNNKITLIKLNKNMGIAYALNIGIEYAIKNNYKWILTLDHDSIVHKDMIFNMINTYETINNKEDVVMITPVHVEEKNFDENKIKKIVGFEYVLTEITSGALTKASYYKNNNYDEKLFIDLVDHDFCLGVNKQGYKIIQVKNAILIHNLGESITKNILGIKVTPTNHGAIRRYYMTRNRLYIWKKYKNDFPKWILLEKRRFVTEIIKIVLFEEKKNEKLKMIFKGIKDYKDGIFGPLE